METREARLLDMWRRRKRLASQYRQLFEPRWLENWQWYRNKKQTDQLEGQVWQSNEIIPDAFRVIETMVPQHVLGMFRTPEWFSVSADTVAGETYQRMVKARLLQNWRRADGYRKSIEGVKYGNVLGHFSVKTYWQTTIGDQLVNDLGYDLDPSGETLTPKWRTRVARVPKHNGPQMDRVDLFNEWIDPTGRGLWVIERIPDQIAALREQDRAFRSEGVPLYTGLDRLKARKRLSDALNESTTSGGGLRTIEDRGDLYESVEGIPRTFTVGEDDVELWQCWGWVDPEVTRYDDTQWRLQIIANGDTLIRDVKCPIPDLRPPYTQVQAIPIPGVIYGESVLSYVGPLIDLRSFIENSRRDEVLLNMFPTMVIARESEVGPNDLFKKPGGVLFMDKGQDDLNRMFSVLPRTPILPEAWQESALKEQQILSTSGATEPFQGSAFGGRTTATEANLIATAGMGRFALATMWFDETFKRDVLRRMFQLDQVYLRQPEVVEMIEEPGFRDEISFQDLRYNVDISVDSGLFGSMDQQQVQAFMQVLQMAAASPEGMLYPKYGEIIRDTAFRLGFPRANKYVRTEDEVAQIQAQQQQQALLEAALGSTGTESPTSPAG